MLKAVGRGVQALDQCDVTFGANEPEMVLRLGDDPQTAEKWFLQLAAASGLCRRRRGGTIGADR